MVFFEKHKKYLFFLVVLSIITISVFGQSSTLGDVNEDNIINIVDALFTAQYYVEMEPHPFNRIAADVDANDIINVVDALFIAQYYIKIIDHFPGESAQLNIPWDWAGIIGTGQSLAVGVKAKPVESITQPFANLKLSKADLEWPISSTDPLLELVPLTEPINRYAPQYPSAWPANILGETPHSSMANQISALLKNNHDRDYVSVHTNVGEDGKALVYLKKEATINGVNGRAYAASMIEVEAITRLAREQGKSYGIGAIIMTHGESDTDNPNYGSELLQLWQDYNSDIKAITGQNEDVLMIVSQQNSWGDNSLSTLAAWQIAMDNPASIVCSGPKYQYPYDIDEIHFKAEGYQELGEKYAEIYYQRVILKNDWQPLQPLNILRNNHIISIDFHVPSPPLVWDENFQIPHQNETQWMNGKGFEITSPRGKETIQSVEISGNRVIITCSEDLPTEGVFVAYAMTKSEKAMTLPHQGTDRWGLLRDSDSFQGLVTGKVQPNYALAFKKAVPLVEYAE
ncbi:MAG: hypothetical protein JXR70_04070 [Spirochaetales bacterium]|nr:hypothetical protein [Spirochaetales bacterium]